MVRRHGDWQADAGVVGDKAVARESLGVEQERGSSGSGVKIKNGVKIVKNMWG